MSTAELAPARRVRRAGARSARRCSATTCTRSTAAARHPAIASSCRSRTRSTASCGIDPEGEQRWNIYAFSLLAFSLAGVLLSYLFLRIQGHLPFNPDHMKGGAAGAVVQHRDQLPHEHELAGLRRRVDDEPPQPDVRAGRAAVPLGGGRHGSRGGVHPRADPPARRRRWAASGSTLCARPRVCCCRSRSSSRSCS